MPTVTVTLPVEDSPGLRAAVHRVLAAVTASGGAVGWLSEATGAESDAWLAPVLAAARSGDGALCVVSVDGRVEAMGAWRRVGPLGGSPMEHVGEVTKVMAHPDARGLGLGDAVMSGLVGSARAAVGVELLTLGCRGNNHLALALYAAHGFREWGRLPHAVGVGADRWDDVRMSLELDRPDGVRLLGGTPGGPGGSPGSQLSPSELEPGLWDPATRFDPEWMERVLHSDFAEHGASGRTYDRAACLALPAEPFRAHLSPLAVAEVAPGTQLLTYVSTVDGTPANRSSLWLAGADGWRLRWHSGTPRT